FAMREESRHDLALEVVGSRLGRGLVRALPRRLRRLRRLRRMRCVGHLAHPSPVILAVLRPRRGAARRGVRGDGPGVPADDRGWNVLGIRRLRRSYRHAGSLRYGMCDLPSDTSNGGTNLKALALGLALAS